MKILVGYVLALAVMIGGFVSAWSWLTTEPVREAVRKPVAAKVRQEPVIARDETVTFPEAPPRPAVLAVAPEQAAAPSPERSPVPPEPSLPATTAPSTTAPSTTASPANASSPSASPASAFARLEEAAPAKPPARPAKKKSKPRYEVMIQQTIQLPDGRIIQRLIPMSARSADAYARYR